MENINNENFLFYTMKAYTSKNYIISEFEDELKRIKYIKRLIKKYKTNGDLRDRLIINHIIVLANVFGVESAVKMLFFKVDSVDYDVLKTFLMFLNYLPESKLIPGIDNKTVDLSLISVDLNVGKILKNL